MITESQLGLGGMPPANILGREDHWSLPYLSLGETIERIQSGEVGTPRGPLPMFQCTLRATGFSQRALCTDNIPTAREDSFDFLPSISLERTIQLIQNGAVGVPQRLHSAHDASRQTLLFDAMLEKEAVRRAISTNPVAILLLPNNSVITKSDTKAMADNDELAISPSEFPTTLEEYARRAIQAHLMQSQHQAWTPEKAALLQTLRPASAFVAQANAEVQRDTLAFQSESTPVTVADAQRTLEPRLAEPKHCALTAEKTALPDMLRPPSPAESKLVEDAELECRVSQLLWKITSTIAMTSELAFLQPRLPDARYNIDLEQRTTPAPNEMPPIESPDCCPFEFFLMLDPAGEDSDCEDAAECAPDTVVAQHTALLLDIVEPKWGAPSRECAFGAIGSEYRALRERESQLQRISSPWAQLCTTGDVAGRVVEVVAQGLRVAPGELQEHSANATRRQSEDIREHEAQFAGAGPFSVAMEGLVFEKGEDGAETIASDLTAAKKAEAAPQFTRASMNPILQTMLSERLARQAQMTRPASCMRTGTRMEEGQRGILCDIKGEENADRREQKGRGKGKSKKFQGQKLAGIGKRPAKIL